MNINPVDGVLEVIALAVEEWKLQNTPEHIKEQVTDLLNQNREQVTLNLLGLEKGWGKWTVDHCNGRNGNSAAGDYLRKVQQEAIEEWFTSMCMPVLSSKTKASIQKSMQEDYEHMFKQQLRRKISEMAERDATALVEKLSVSNQAENYLKVVKLLHPQTNTD